MKKIHLCYILLLKVVFVFSQSKNEQFQKANNYFNSQNYELSISAFQNLLKAFPQDTQIYFVLGKVYFEKKNYDSSLICFNKTIEFDKNFQEVYFSRALTYVAKHDFKSAILDFDKVLELNRLCLMENNKNESSFLVANSIKLLPRPTIVVSYADTGQGHVGYVYQATNFLFTGTTKERTDMDAGEGKHSRHGTDPSIRKFRSAKHRYIFIHGSKTQKNLLKTKY